MPENEKENKPKKRKTTALDRAVIRYQQSGKKRTYNRIHNEILYVVRAIANKYAWLFTNMTAEDLIQEGYLHINQKVIPVYDADRAGFKTLVTIALRHKFKQLLDQIQKSEKNPTGIPTVTFTEFEWNTGIDAGTLPTSHDFIEDILVDDFLNLFKERLTRDHWAIYYRLYRDPQLKFKELAEEKGISVAGLYRKSRSIYSFLKMLVEKEVE